MFDFELRLKIVIKHSHFRASTDYTTLQSIYNQVKNIIELAIQILVSLFKQRLPVFQS
jgi:hypothetical protein